MNFKTLPELLDYFKDEKTCEAYFEQTRWNGKVTCPHCNHEKVYRTNRGFKCGNTKCYKKFTVRTKTVFEGSKISMRYWFASLYICTSHKKGISSIQLGRDLGISQKTAWFMLHRIREILREKSPIILGDNPVEVDETYFGGKEKNKHANKKYDRTALTVAEKKKKGGEVFPHIGKIPVIGLIERNGKVVARRIPDTKAKTVLPFIQKHVKKGSAMMSDEWYAYGQLTLLGYTHKSIEHQRKIYVEGEVHTNTIENFWSVLKRGMYGIYHTPSKKHLNRYLDEFTARFNSRDKKEAERFVIYLHKTEGRIKYRDLTKPTL